jgi:ABC-type Na+ transport system ATPase subunit NatA
MQEVEAICDRVIILNNGVIVANNFITEIVKEEKLEDFFRRLTN